MVDLGKKGGYNQGYLATIKMNNKYNIVKSKRENKKTDTKDNSVRLNRGYLVTIKYK